jgi:hypothetical protein
MAASRAWTDGLKSLPTAGGPSRPSVFSQACSAPAPSPHPSSSPAPRARCSSVPARAGSACPLRTASRDRRETPEARGSLAPRDPPGAPESRDLRGARERPAHRDWSGPVRGAPPSPMPPAIRQPERIDLRCDCRIHRTGSDECTRGLGSPRHRGDDRRRRRDGSDRRDRSHGEHRRDGSDGCGRNARPNGSGGNHWPHWNGRNARGAWHDGADGPAGDSGNDRKHWING